ncbi:MAG: FtsX-like permease family protein [Candidatus Poseidoniales archaeon]|nr:FtsX-like permease family protein [Candidatus Poseidoniales archaeon]
MNKRLARSLWRTKLRLSAVVFMVAVGVFAGISFGAYANAATNLYDEIYDGEEGVNLPDIWINNPSGIWDANTSSNICDSISQNWPDSQYELETCEQRLIVDGIMFYDYSSGEEKAIPAIWHGIDEGLVDKVWMPTDSDLSSGRLALSSDEIVLDSHIAMDLDIKLGGEIEVSSGSDRMMYTVVGIGFHSQHLYFAQEGMTLPADDGTFATGYMTASGLERLTNLSEGSSNLILIDIQGTPSYDLQSTDDVDEGKELNFLIDEITDLVSLETDVPVSVYDRSGVDSVEFLRADAEGAVKMFPYVTGMIAVIAGITIFLSLQRLIQSQAREIAVLRTLGVPKSSIMPGYIIAPVVIGGIGSLIGVLLGVYFGAPSMLGLYEKMIGLPISSEVDKSLIFQVVIISMTIVLLAGLRPAWQASRLQPLAVFRGQHEVKLSSRRLQRFTASLPTTIGLSIRSSLRKPMRVGFTFFAVGISMLLFGSMLFMLESMEGSIIGGITDRQSWDVQASNAPGGEDALVDWVEQNNGQYELLITFPIGLEDDNRELTAYGLDNISTVNDGESMIMVDLLEGEIPDRNSDTMQVLIDEGTSIFLEWGTGDVVPIYVGNMQYNVEISGITEGEISRTMYMYRANLSQMVGIESTSVLIQLSDDNKSLEGLAELSVGYTQKEDAVNTFETLLEQQKKMFYAIEFLGIIIAVAVLFNTLLMNMAERDTELATLRVLGAPMNKLGKMMFWEHLGIGVIGGILGAIFAYFGTVLLVSSMVQWAFYFTVAPDPGAILTIIGVIVGISVALTPFGMWRIKKMNLVDKVKDLSN